MSALEDLDAVSYELKGDPANPTLVWLPQEKTWGPNFLKADIGIYTSAASDDNFIFYLQHARTWVNDLGAQWRNEMQLGTDKMLSTSFYQPFDTAQRFFVEPKLVISDTRQDVYSDGDRLARYRFKDRGGMVDFGMNLGSYSQVRAGYAPRVAKCGWTPVRRCCRKTTCWTRASRFPSCTIHATRRSIPPAAWRPRSNTVAPTMTLAAIATGRRAELGVGLALPLRNDVLWLNVAAGTDFGSDLPVDRLFILGGPMSFPGHDVGELRAGSYWTLSSGYLVETEGHLHAARAVAVLGPAAAGRAGLRPV